MMEFGTYIQEMRKRFQLTMVAVRTVGGVYLLYPVQIRVNKMGTRHHLHPALYSRVLTFGDECAHLVVI
jgi:hypothetical protein